MIQILTKGIKPERLFFWNGRIDNRNNNNRNDKIEIIYSRK